MPEPREQNRYCRRIRALDDLKAAAQKAKQLGEQVRAQRTTSMTILSRHILANPNSGKHSFHINLQLTPVVCQQRVDHSTFGAYSLTSHTFTHTYEPTKNSANDLLEEGGFDMCQGLASLWSKSIGKGLG